MASSRSAKKRKRTSSTRARSTRARSTRSATRASARNASGRTSGRNTAKGRSAGSSRNGSGRDDAIALLKADHREVERLFGEFESTRSADRKSDLAARICSALRVHATIEEEIFYPAFLEATRQTEIHHEAEIEHEGAKRLIDEIENTGADDDHFEARVSVLREMIRHHVKEEERSSGMFSKARASELDLRSLGRRLEERKLELKGESDEGGMQRMPPGGRSRGAGRDMRMRSH